MCKDFPQRHYCVSLLLIISTFLTGLVPLTGLAQDRRRKPIVVTFGQPNIWSLEQAHYLLARMHMTNLSLQAKGLSEEELNPNATHGTRIEILKQLLDISGSFDQGIGFQNQRIVETARFNDERRRTLTTNRDRLRNDSLNLEMQINELTRERKTITDPNSERAKQLDAQIEEKQKNQAKIDKEITFQDNEIGKLGAEPSGAPTAPSVSSGFDKTKLPSSVLDSLTAQELQKLLDPGRDPKLNATTMLDNTVQLQYEIIAKQLTLLRDEVGPGERLVFLELPQSIYSTPDSGDEKMAQTWWHVNGYTRTDPLVRLLLELYELELKWKRIQAIRAFEIRLKDIEAWQCDEEEEKEKGNKPNKAIEEKIKEDPVLDLFVSLKCERKTARKAVLGKLYREANNVFARVGQNGARDTADTVEAIRRLLVVSRTEITDDDGKRTNVKVDAKGKPGTEELVSPTKSQTLEDDRRAEIEKLRGALLEILSDENLATPEDKVGPSVDDRILAALKKLKDLKILSGSEFERGMEFVRLDEEVVRPLGINTNIDRRTVRTVDVIPRQSSLNVNDVQETVKATGILAAFKFLFGFAGQVNYQRQREQFEQFIHQELYASGFGKGNRDFGWTFGAIPGTKRVAPGIRTTYAALVVPENAESIVLSARGCYFPRKNYQPLNFEDTGHNDWRRESKFKSYNCSDDENYILPIPGGGDISNFWVTSIDYQDGQKGGDYATVSVRGNNFSSQMGVLVDGVPLFPTVGLAQLHLMPKKPGANGAEPPPLASECVGATGICGRYERVDSEQIVFSFKMPANYTGIPTITLIAPGKSIDLNSIPVRINRGTANSTLREDGAFMFGRRPPRFTITDVQLLNVDSNSPDVEALVEGRGFNALLDQVYVNGAPVVAPQKEFKSPNLYKLTFPKSSLDTLEFKIVRGTEVVTKFLPNPSSMEIISATVVSYDPPVPKKSPGVMTVKLQVVGPSQRLGLVGLQGASTHSTLVPGASSGEAIVRLIDPEPTVVITIIDNGTRGVASVAVQRPKEAPKPAEQPAPKPKEEPKPKPCLVPLCSN